jgi:hydroxypyruvate isomerase
MCLIEPLSTRSNYYLRSYTTAMDIVKSSKTDNLKIMLDSFHLQRLHGNLTERVQVNKFHLTIVLEIFFKELIPFVGHVQISQTPKRDCPMSEDGEVNHQYFLSKLIAPFYQDFIGLEYNGKRKWREIFRNICFLICRFK